MELVAAAQLGEAFDFKHKFIFGFKRPPPDDRVGQWYMPLTAFPQAGVAAWLVQEKKIASIIYLDFDFTLTEPTIISVFSIGPNLRARPVAFKSWAYQARTLQQMASFVPKGVRLVAGTEYFFADLASR